MKQTKSKFLSYLFFHVISYAMSTSKVKSFFTLMVFSFIYIYIYIFDISAQKEKEIPPNFSVLLVVFGPFYLLNKKKKKKSFSHNSSSNISDVNRDAPKAAELRKCQNLLLVVLILIIKDKVVQH